MRVMRDALRSRPDSSDAFDTVVMAQGLPNPLLAFIAARNSIRAYLAEFGIVAPVGRRGVHMPSWFLVSRDTLEHA
jgi:hypothetical protein